MDIKGKHIFITGAAAGIGFETASVFARQGAHLWLSDINPQALAIAADKLKTNEVNINIWECDVTSAKAVGEMSQAIHAQVPAMDVIVCNAGIGFFGEFTDTPPAQWRKVIEVNVMGVVHVINAFLPAMRALGGKRRVVTVASAAGLGPVGGLSAYVASKHAAVGLSDALALELADSEVGVTLVCPGIINTAIVSPTPGSFSAKVTPAQLEHINAYYRQKGCHPKVVGEAIVEAVKKERGLILPGPEALSGYWVRRLLPRSLYLQLAGAASRKIGFLTKPLS